MKARIIKFAGACLFALAGHVSVDASPTFSESCFETEEKAKARQSVYQSREVDNSKSTEMDKLARALVGVQDVELSELKSILGESKITCLRAAGGLVLLILFGKLRVTTKHTVR